MVVGLVAGARIGRDPACLQIAFQRPAVVALLRLREGVALFDPDSGAYISEHTTRMTGHKYFVSGQGDDERRIWVVAAWAKRPQSIAGVADNCHARAYITVALRQVFR